MNYQRVTWKPTFTAVVKGDYSRKRIAKIFEEWMRKELHTYMITKDLDDTLTIEGIRNEDVGRGPIINDPEKWQFFR